MNLILNRLFLAALCAAVLVFVPAALAQGDAQAPFTNEEFLARVRLLPKRPDLKAELIDELRRRGINFTLTSGLRSVVATKSGHDAELRRVLEEAERRYLNPETVGPRPSDAEAAELLARTREATLASSERMPDFVVKQLIARAYAFGKTKNWVPQDRLVVGVSYRASEGERYRLLAQNGLPAPGGLSDESGDYTDAGGTSSTGEFVTALKALFAEESKTDFKLLGTDTIRNRRALIYQYEVRLPHSGQTISYGKVRTVRVGYRGKVWIDREHARVLRIESEAVDIPADFPVTATKRAVDYDWVNIPGQGDYLLPSRAVLEMTALSNNQLYQSRNDIRFRGYQKYGTELKIIEDDIFEEGEPVAEPAEPEKPPAP